MREVCALLVVQPFEPVVDERCRLLILGSIPSVLSRQNAFYYGNPQNRFWRMLSAVFDEAVPKTVQEKKELLLRRHIALWDVLASCEIEGSSDASIRRPVPADLNRILQIAPIEKVLCNGTSAGKMYARFQAKLYPLPMSVLPSTSPANAAWTLPRLISAWTEALRP